MVELTVAHWVYAGFIVLVLVTMAWRRETPLDELVESFMSCFSLLLPVSAWSGKPMSVMTHAPRLIQSRSTPLVQYFCICSADGTFNGRTTRKPTNWASEKYQMLLGNCGSCIFQERSEPRRAALRHITASSSQEPPRTECG